MASQPRARASGRPASVADESATRARARHPPRPHTLCEHSEYRARAADSSATPVARFIARRNARARQSPRAATTANARGLADETATHARRSPRSHKAQRPPSPRGRPASKRGGHFFIDYYAFCFICVQINFNLWLSSAYMTVSGRS